MVDVKKIGTEQRNEKTKDIDIASTGEILKLINDEDKTVAFAVEKALTQISALVDQIVTQLKKGGRMIYMGAGTSGRIGVMDAAEVPPTFSVDPSVVQCLIAGGDWAMNHAVEGAEDSKELAYEALEKVKLNADDVVIGITASGRTPYSVGGIEYANKLGCVTGCITTSPNSEIASKVKYPIEAITGAEPITGSTRMKSGTAQKLICNMLTTATMIKLGKVYQNFMVDVQATNEKLIKRSQNIIVEATGVSFAEAAEAIEKFGSVKKALFAIITGTENQKIIDESLEATSGHLRKAIEKVKNE